MPRSKSPPIRATAPYHIDWKLMRTYRGLYKSSRGDEITIRSLTRPPTTRTFRSSSGRRRYKLVDLKSTKREVIIVASTKNRKNKVDTEELEEIEALEELEDELDEEEPEAIEEDDEDEDDEPTPKKSKKGKTTAKAKSSSRAKANGRVGTAELAEAFGVDSRTLRMVLRKHSIEKDEETGRYEWDSMKDKTVVRIGKLIAKGEADNIKKDALDKLKARKAEKVAEGKAAKKGKGKKSKKAKVVEEDEDDD